MTSLPRKGSRNKTIDLLNLFRKKEESTIHFKTWLLTLISIGNFILAPMIIQMAV